MRFLGLFLVTGLLAGCEADSGAPMTTTDSAGVLITLSPDQARVFAVVDPEPVLNLGGPNAIGPTQFFGVQNIHVDSELGLWVADRQSAELRMFRSDGSHLGTQGGRGEGPGEFVRLGLLGSFAADSVAVWDDGLGRLTVFDGDGELARTQPIQSVAGTPIHGVDVFEDGALLGQISRVIRASSLEAGQILGDSARLVRISPRDSTERFMAGAPGPLWLWTGRTQVPIPFTANAGFEVVGEAVHLVAGPEFRVRVFVDGQLSAIYGVAREPREVSEADREAYRAFILEYLSGGDRDEYLSALDHIDVPGELPGYSRVIAATDAHVWAHIYSPDPLGPAEWDVYGSRGEWLGQVVTPPDFTLMSVSADRLTGVWRDDLGVEYARVYRLRPGGEIH